MSEAKDESLEQMNEVIIYKTLNDQTQVEVQFENETVWLTQKQMALLFAKSLKTINEHVKNIYQEHEVERTPTIRNFRIVQKEGKRTIEREIEHYNLDVIISIGYRVKSKQGTQFRQWATQRLKDYLVKGYAINEQRLKASAQQLSDLKKSMKLLENMVQQKQLSTDEAIYSQYLRY